MSLSDVLQQDAEGMYHATRGLFRKVKDLNWRPATGSNWMDTAQLLKHCTQACGSTIHGFVEQGWGVPASEAPSGDEAVGMVPSLEELPRVSSVEEALDALEADRLLCLRTLEGVDDERLLNERSVAPWGGPEMTLFQHCSGMIWHLGQHKGQLFYYLKLQGMNVGTFELWGG
jgi:hypothetical protein